MLRCISFFFIIMLSSCFSDDYGKPLNGFGMRPIYVQIGDDMSLEAMQFDDLTNIVVYQELIFAVEENVGIHVIDNTDPTNPVNTLFIPVNNLTNIALKDDIVIANVGEILISIDISDRSRAILKKITIIESPQPEGRNLFPDGYNGLFECVDTNKGFVSDWELVIMEDSDCWR